MKQISSVLLSLALTLCMLTPQVSAAEITMAGDARVPVELTQEATAFSVTVPTVLPVNVSATGEVTVATDNKIVNNSYGPVEVKGIEVVSLNDWVLQEFSTDFKTKKVGIKEYGFQMNGEGVGTDGSCAADSFGVIPGNDEILFSYNAKVASQSVALDKEQIAQVVFTMGWSSAPLDKSIFSNNSWEEIIIACQTDNVPITWSVGDTKPMTINGEEYNIQIIGKNHDTYSAGGTAPLTFQMVELYNAKYPMHQGEYTINWSRTEMRTMTLPAILEDMPSEVQTAIKSVDKMTQDCELGEGLKSTSDKLFLLSTIEVFGTGLEEGFQYSFYANGGSSIKTFEGNADDWWLRSTSEDFDGFNSFVKAEGIYSFTRPDVDSIGVAFAFCF